MYFEAQKERKKNNDFSAYGLIIVRDDISRFYLFLF